MNSPIRVDTDALREAASGLDNNQLAPAEYSHGILRDHAIGLIRDHPFCDSYRPQTAGWIAEAGAAFLTLITAFRDSEDRLRAVVNLFQTIDAQGREAWGPILERFPSLLANPDLTAMVLLEMTADQLRTILAYGSLLTAAPGVEAAVFLSALQTVMFAGISAEDPLLTGILFPSGVSDNAVKFIARFETGGKIISPPTDALDGLATAGFGHVLHNGRCTIEERNMVVTEEMAVRWMRADLANAEETVRTYVKVPLSQQQYDALVSAVYNVGPNLLWDSKQEQPTRLLQDLNTGDYAGAADDLLEIHHLKDPDTDELVDSPGLLRRRREEKEMWEAGDYGVDSASKWQ